MAEFFLHVIETENRDKTRLKTLTEYLRWVRHSAGQQTDNGKPK